MFFLEYPVVTMLSNNYIEHACSRLSVVEGVMVFERMAYVSCYGAEFMIR